MVARGGAIVVSTNSNTIAVEAVKFKSLVKLPQNMEQYEIINCDCGKIRFVGFRQTDRQTVR